MKPSYWDAVVCALCMAAGSFIFEIFTAHNWDRSWEHSYFETLAILAFTWILRRRQP